MLPTNIGDYEEAKTQIDSIKILYPKALRAAEARSGIDAGCGTQGSTRDSGLSGQCCSRQSKEHLMPSKARYTLEKDAEYQQVGNSYGLHKPSRRISMCSFLRFQVSEKGNYEHDFHLLRSRQYPSCRRQSDDLPTVVLPRTPSFEGQLRNIGYEREKSEKADYKLGEDGNVIEFLNLNKDKNIRVEFIGDRQIHNDDESDRPTGSSRRLRTVGKSFPPCSKSRKNRKRQSENRIYQ